MIDASEMLPLLVQAYPGFALEWAEFQQEWAHESSLPYYLILSAFARHMCGMLATKDRACLTEIFAVIERLLLEGSPYVKEAATIGLLESLQNTHLHSSTTLPAQFECFLLPETMRYWQKVASFWADGKLITDE